ncbi:MAG: 3-phosphoshikimate 1-carboxyvinyltransferase [Clostridia bacterium]|nr:3-phosphoshikimate 1-carboxyvinyltransferase [Clostridia bacterium]
MQPIDLTTESAVLAPGPRAGSVLVPSSKSQLHRLLICASQGDTPADICCRGISADIRATAACLGALGAVIREAPGEDGWQVLRVSPLDRGCSRENALLCCGESGSTLRFLLPLAGALGASCTFRMEGRLPDRPLAPLDGQLSSHGMTLRKDGCLLKASGRLQSGSYVLPGNVSSQYVSGLLMALGGLLGPSSLRVQGKLESSAYIAMTEDALRLSGIRFSREEASDETVWRIPGDQTVRFPAKTCAEGDYSSATFFLCMGALSEEGILVKGLDASSSQGDKAVLWVLSRIGARVTPAEGGILVKKGGLRAAGVDASQIPDAVPALAALLALCEGESRIYNGERLRLKESDRLQSTARMLRSLGADAEETADGLRIRGKSRLRGGKADPSGDHRIAMAAAVAACGCEAPAEVKDARCVDKSYPGFWQDLGGLKTEKEQV